MSDQTRLPVTFPPGTEIPVTGKVEITAGKIEVTNTVKVDVVNVPTVEVTKLEQGGAAALQVEVTNTPTVKLSGTSKVEVTNVSKVELDGGTAKVEVTNIPEVKLNGTSKVEVTGTSKVEVTNVPKVELDGGTAKVEVTNIPEVKVASGKIEVTNTVKVEGVTAGSKLKIENGAGAEEASVKEKRLLVTDGLKAVEVVGSVSEETIIFKCPSLAAASYMLQSFYAAFSLEKAKEKSIFTATLTIDVAGKRQYYFEELLGERLGTGEINTNTNVSCAQGLVVQKYSGTTADPHFYYACPMPLIRGGLGLEVEVKMRVSSSIGSVKAEEGRLFYISNEGTL
jgi:hypothetical protein